MSQKVIAALDATPWVSQYAASLVGSRSRCTQYDHWTNPTCFPEDDAPFHVWNSDGSKEGYTCPSFVRYWEPPAVQQQYTDQNLQDIMTSYRLTAAGYFSPYSMGKLGHVHEGAVGSMFDEFLWRAGMLCGLKGPTLNLKVCHHKPIALSADGAVVLLEGRLTKIEPRGNKYKVFVEGNMLNGSVSPSELLVSATALFLHTREDEKVFMAKRQETISEKAASPVNLKILSPPILQGFPRTSLASELLNQQGSDWNLKNKMFATFESSGNWKQMGLRHLLLETPRLIIDLLWSPAFQRIRMCCGFSRLCYGPPGSGWVHGGCIYSVIAGAAAFRAHVNAAGEPNSAETVASELSVDYKASLPLVDEYDEYIIDAELSGNQTDSCRIDVEVKLTSAVDPKIIIASGRASFVKVQSGQLTDDHLHSQGVRTSSL